MEFVRLALVFLHLLGMGLLLGTFLLQLRVARTGPLNSGWLHGAGLQLLTGLALVGVNEAAENELDNVKVAVKLGVLVVIFVLILVARRRGRADSAPLPSWAAPALGALVVLNTGIAVFWT